MWRWQKSSAPSLGACRGCRRASRLCTSTMISRSGKRSSDMFVGSASNGGLRACVRKGFKDIVRAQRYVRALPAQG